MAEKMVKGKPEKAKKVEPVQAEKSKVKVFQKPAKPAEKDKDRDKPKKENALARWWRETIGELRKVAWPSRQDTVRLTEIVLLVMLIMGSVLGLLDWLFSRLIALLVS